MVIRYKLIMSLAIFILCVFLFSTRIVSANWYAWYSSENESYYGVWATIFTPSGPPVVATGDSTSHSVTTPGGRPWIQAGWSHYPGQSANRYYEYGVGGDHLVIPVGIHYWGTGIKYEVSQDGNPSLQRWCAWIDGVQQECFSNIALVPSIVVIQSEDHTNPQQTVFYTDFQSIKVRNSGGIWVTPTLQNHLHSNSPYGITQLSVEGFLTWRYGLFLPIIKK